MIQFLTRPILSPIGKRRWRLRQDLTLSYHGRFFTAPKDFITDLASVPRVFWPIIPPFGKYSGAAIIHDYFYQTHCIDRKAADRVFIETMEALGVAKWKRRAMYRAVRMFGWMPWKKKEK